jgi:uncharacterized protein YjcR
MDRDPKTGRFLPGNQLAVGNRGNSNPKWGNKNAMKHGLFGALPLAKVLSDGCLYIYISRKSLVKIKPDGFIKEKDGNIRIRNDLAERLEKMGIALE